MASNDRYTRNIEKKQTYCKFDIKNVPYQRIYEFGSWANLEDYVDTDLTLAIDKLGELEDIEQEIGCNITTIYPLLKKVFKGLKIAVDIKSPEECYAIIGVKVGQGGFIVIYETHNYNECLILKDLSIGKD